MNVLHHLAWQGIASRTTAETGQWVHSLFQPQRSLRRLMRPGLLLAVGAGLSACGYLSGPPSGTDVRFRVVDSEGRPLVGVAVWGGFDWSAWRTRTDSAGLAAAPGSDIGQSATLAATSYLPRVVTLSADAVYVLEQTPLRLEVLGLAEGAPWGEVPVVRILGDAIGVQGDTVTTLYNAGVRRYTYGAGGAELLGEYGLVNPGRGFSVFGAVERDELWVLTVLYGPSPRQTFVRAYSPALTPERALVDQAVPSGHWIKRKDSLVVVGGEYEDSIRVFVASSGGLRQLGALAHPGATSFSGAYRAFFMGDALLIARITSGSELRLVDLADPSDPQIRGILTWPEPRQVIPLGDSLLVGPPSFPPDLGLPPASYQVFDFSNPFEPVEVGRVQSDAYLEEVRADGWAFGAWTGDGWTASILRLEGLRYRLQSTVTLGPSRYGGLNAIAPPYFIADGLVLRMR